MCDQILIDDLANRFPAYEFTPIQINDVVRYVVTADAGNTVVTQVDGPDVETVMHRLHGTLIECKDIVLPLATTTQRDAWTDVIAGQQILNITTNTVQTYTGSEWI